MLEPSLGKQQAQKTQRDCALIRGDSPVIDHLHMPVVLSSSRSAPENKKSSGKVQGVPKAPAKDQRLTRVQGRIDALSICRKIPLA
jgi:hypothetical protein